MGMNEDERDDVADYSSPAFWGRQLAEAVRFDRALATLATDFPDAVLVEVGPSVLAGILSRAARELGTRWDVVPTLKRAK